MLAQQLVDIGDARLEVFTGGTQGPIICEAHPFNPLIIPDRWSDALLDEGVCRIVKVNPRDFGRSSRGTPSDAPLVDRLVEDLEKVRVQLGIERWIFFGHSAGGLSGIVYALRYPHSLHALILASISPSLPFAIADERSVLSPQNRSHQRSADEIAYRLSEVGIVMEDEPRWVQVRDQLMVYARGTQPIMFFPMHINARQQSGVLETAGFDALDRLEQIHLPALVICGQGDRLFPPHLCELLGRIPGSQVVIIDKSGHSPMQEAPAAFRSAVRDFLMRLGI